jgi:hypothetical protein
MEAAGKTAIEVTVWDFDERDVHLRRSGEHSALAADKHAGVQHDCCQEESLTLCETERPEHLNALGCRLFRPQHIHR